MKVVTEKKGQNWSLLLKNRNRPHVTGDGIPNVVDSLQRVKQLVNKNKKARIVYMSSGMEIRIMNHVT